MPFTLRVQLGAHASHMVLAKLTFLSFLSPFLLPFPSAHPFFFFFFFFSLYLFPLPLSFSPCAGECKS